MKIAFIFLINLIFFSNIVFCQTNPSFIKDSLDTYISESMQAWNIPGVAVCIVKEGKVIHQKGYGLTQWGENEKVNEQTIFPIASVSKQFIGAALAILEAQGKVSLDDKMEKWLPEFEMKDKDYHRQIILTDLLSHRSGWKTFQGDLLNTESSMDVQTMLKKFGQLTPAYPIRTRFGYSNFGFLLAGETIKHIYGKNWQNFLKERILDPLNMHRTYIHAEAINEASNITSEHTVQNNQIMVLQGIKADPQPYGGFFSSVHDLGIWMNVLLNKGTNNGLEIIPDAAIEKMWRSHTIIGKDKAADGNRYFKTYGLGWEIMQYNGVEVMQHGGAYSGALSMIGLVPSLKLGIIILTNQDAHMLHETLKWQVIDAYLGNPAPNYTKTIIERRAKRDAERGIQPKPTAVKDVATELFSVPVDQITGTYACDSYGEAKIVKRGNQLVLTLEFHPGLEGILTHYNKNEFNCVYNNLMFGETVLPFIIKKGKVRGFTLFVDDFIERDGYEFSKQNGYK